MTARQRGSRRACPPSAVSATPFRAGIVVQREGLAALTSPLLWQRTMCCHRSLLSFAPANLRSRPYVLPWLVGFAPNVTKEALGAWGVVRLALGDPTGPTAR